MSPEAGVGVELRPLAGLVGGRGVTRGGVGGAVVGVVGLAQEGLEYKAFDSELWNGPLFGWRRHDGVAAEN